MIDDLREVRRVLDQLGLFNPRVSNLRFSIPTEASCRDSTESHFVVYLSDKDHHG